MTMTAAGTRLPSPAADAGTSSAAAANSSSVPSTGLVEPGTEVTVRTPVVSQVADRTPIPVATPPSRARKAITEAVSCSGNVNVISTSPTACASWAPNQPSCSAASTSVAPPRARKPSGSGDASGRTTKRTGLDMQVLLDDGFHRGTTARGTFETRGRG